MAHQQHQSCIEACVRCAQECHHCADACPGESEVAKLAECIRLDRDCARICWEASAFMSSGSRFAAALCRLCAEICDACGAECQKHQPWSTASVARKLVAAAPRSAAKWPGPKPEEYGLSRGVKMGLPMQPAPSFALNRETEGVRIRPRGTCVNGEFALTWRGPRAAGDPRQRRPFPQNSEGTRFASNMAYETRDERSRHASCDT